METIVKKIILLIVLVMLSGCASVKNIRDTARLEPKSGIMLVNFESNHYGYKATIINKKNITWASAVFDIKRDDNLRVITLPAGDYTWRGIYVGTGASEFRDDYDFTIQEGYVNYVGDVLIIIDGRSNRYKISFSDNEKTISRFKEEYPKLAENNKIIKNITNRPNKKDINTK